MGTLPCAAHGLLLAPIAALAAAFFVFHRFWPKKTHWPILASCGVVTACSWWLAARVLHGEAWDDTLFQWIAVSGFQVEFGMRIDGLSASVLAMVTLVGTLIHVYAVGYMEEDPGFSRFFMYFHLFFFSMIGLLVSNNYVQLYGFWEGVGLASFLLIGFWYDRESARAAAWKAFLTNRIGDMGFLLAVLLLLSRFGTTRFDEVFASLQGVDARFIAVVCALLFWGASAKSAQFPLHVWLPDAMEGPTPVSALMHAATMVTAGVFLMARSWPMLERAPEIRLLIACVGGGTALGAAVVASMKKDIKRILAYSTVSHLGLMMLAIGCGSVYAAVFHLITHGFFKAVLFLCAGSVIHGLGSHGTVTVDETGGLARQMPWTAGAFFVGSLALAGIPPLSGFFSKDLIIDSVFEGGPGLLVPIALLVAAGSGFYIFRMNFLTFYGERAEQSGPSAHAHEAPAPMLLPVLALAACSAVAGVAGTSGFLSRMLAVEEPHMSAGKAAIGVGLACLGIFAAWVWTTAKPSWDWAWRASNPGLERALDAEFGWQPIASCVARFGASASGWLAWRWDIARWDAFIGSVADSTLGLGEGLSGLSRGLLNEYLLWILAGSAALAAVTVLCF
ncbi:MAG: NADH-quinone oxidoreductase subunit L [Elusimicrobia bacterium]|nr:NADH-quinone oxidoreductase subunit L [Elusimicrobiota bacterium]